jgi:hypothetical protein
VRKMERPMQTAPLGTRRAKRDLATTPLTTTAAVATSRLGQPFMPLEMVLRRARCVRDGSRCRRQLRNAPRHHQGASRLGRSRVIAARWPQASRLRTCECRPCCVSWCSVARASCQMRLCRGDQIADASASLGVALDVTPSRYRFRGTGVSSSLATQKSGANSTSSALSCG